MAQGVAWMARELGVPATIVVPDNASATKLAAVERLGGRIVRVSWEQWWAAVDADGERDLGEGVEGFFVHPVQDPAGDGRATAPSASSSSRTSTTSTPSSSRGAAAG